MDSQLLNTLITLLAPLVTLAVTALISYLAAMAKAKTAQIKNSTAQQIFAVAIDEAARVAREAVLATQQTLVDSFKKAAEDGKLTKDEKDEALALAQAYFLSHISKGGIDVLTAAIGPIEDWLADYMENKVKELKLYYPLQSQ